MTLYDRYISGQTEQVYQHMLALGKEAFSSANQSEIDLDQQFRRLKNSLLLN
jgi:hypothetical protein